MKFPLLFCSYSDLTSAFEMLVPTKLAPTREIYELPKCLKSFKKLEHRTLFVKVTKELFTKSLGNRHNLYRAGFYLSFLVPAEYPKNAIKRLETLLRKHGTLTKEKFMERTNFTVSFTDDKNLDYSLLDAFKVDCT